MSRSLSGLTGLASNCPVHAEHPDPNPARPRVEARNLATSLNRPRDRAEDLGRKRTPRVITPAGARRHRPRAAAHGARPHRAGGSSDQRALAISAGWERHISQSAGFRGRHRRHRNPPLPGGEIDLQIVHAARRRQRCWQKPGTPRSTSASPTRPSQKLHHHRRRCRHSAFSQHPRSTNWRREVSTLHRGLLPVDLASCGTGRSAFASRISTTMLHEDLKRFFDGFRAMRDAGVVVRSVVEMRCRRHCAYWDGPHGPNGERRPFWLLAATIAACAYKCAVWPALPLQITH